MEAEEEGMAAEAEVAQAVAGKGEADIAVAELGLPLLAVLTRTQWVLTTMAPLPGKSPTDLLCISPLHAHHMQSAASLAVSQLRHSVPVAQQAFAVTQVLRAVSLSDSISCTIRPEALNINISICLHMLVADTTCTCLLAARLPHMHTRK